MNTQEDVTEYFKTKRDQYMVQIRKKKHSDIIRAKRAKLASDFDDKENFIDNPEDEDYNAIFQKIQIHAEAIQESFKIQNLYDLNLALRKLRQTLSYTDEPPVKEVVATGVVRHIVNLIDEKYKKNEDLLSEASWIIANIASAESHHVTYLISLEVVKRAMWLLDHPNLEIKENAIWILSNIAADSVGNRDMLIKNDLVIKMDRLLLKNNYKGSLLQQSVWLISNLCGGKPYPEYYLVAPLLLLLQKLIQNSSDKKVLQYVLWTFIYLADGEPGQIEDIINLDCCERFIQLLESDESEIRVPALKLLGILLTGEDYQVEYLTNLGLIEPLARLLKSSKKLLRRLACFAFSNILTANEQEIDKVLNYCDGWIFRRFNEMMFEGEQEISFEIIFCLGNLCCARVLEQIEVAVKHGLLSIISESLKNYEDIEVTKVLLEMVNNILDTENDYNHNYDGNGPYYKQLQAYGVFTRIENLLDHDSKEVSDLAEMVTKKHLQFE